MKRFLTRAAATLSVFLLAAVPAMVSAQTAWPTKTVRMIVAFPPGGFGDLSGRLLAQQLSQKWGQSVVMENRPGAGGILASEVAAKAPADGYTLYYVSDGPLLLNPWLYKSLPYDPVNDFVPAALVASVSMVLVANPDKIPAKNLQQFIAYVKSNSARPPDYGSAGLGGPHQLFMESFKQQAHIELNHIAYKGGNQALQAVMAGEIAAAFGSPSAADAAAKTGKLVVYGIGAPKRSLLVPDVPTFAEQGFPNFNATAWQGVVAPKGTPAAIVSKIETDTLAVARDLQFQQKLLLVGGDPYPGTAGEFRDMITRERARYGALIKSLNFKPE